MRGNKGITLIALVITIIVLLILAGVSIAMLSGDNSILKNSKAADKQTAIGSAKEQLGLIATEAITDYYRQAYVEGNATVQSNGVAYAVMAALAADKTTYDGITYTKPKAPSAALTQDGTITFTYTADGEVYTGTINKDSGALTFEMTTAGNSNY